MKKHMATSLITSKKTQHKLIDPQKYSEGKHFH